MKKDINHLLEKYHRNTCTQEEIRFLEAFFIQTGNHAEGSEPDQEIVNRMLFKIQTSSRYRQRSPSSTNRKLILSVGSIAATLLLFVGLWAYEQYPFKTTRPGHQNTRIADIAPGNEKAILTLSDGAKVPLNDRENGTIVHQQETTVIKNSDGVLVYSTEDAQDNYPAVLEFNTIETPRGGHYKIILPDGSSAWLNASSTITFPVRFSAKERRIHMTGEVYFEIAKQALPIENETISVPFIVETSNQTVEVLGTHFNINSYPEEAIERTTLMEGRVNVTHRASGKKVPLQPGQQAQTSNQIRVIQADIEKDLAWKRGDFIFKKERLSNILQQVSRWYDIDISYPDHLAELQFNGMVSRKQPLSVIIAMIESTGKVKIKLKGRRAIVTE